MEQHAVPHSVTSFEFKLIGWFTVKQFMYLLLFSGLAVVLYFAIPVPILNILLGIASVLLGVALVFYRVNERPLDVWLRNMIVSLMRPSQFFYHKDNDVPAFLKDVRLTPNESVVANHLDASQKLSSYMAQTGQKQVVSADKQAMNTLIHTTPANQAPAAVQAAQVTQAVPASPQVFSPIPGTVQPATAVQKPMTDMNQDGHAQAQVHPTPFLSGVIRNNKDAPLPNIMVYVNSNAGQVVRILKTNHNGIFATFHTLPAGTYILSPKDMGGTYFFDTMNVTIEGPLAEPVQIYSKELL